VRACLLTLFVVVSVCERISETTYANFTKFCVHVACAVAQSSSDDIAIHYVLPVLWMTSCFHTVVQMLRHFSAPRG